jgi:type II secretory pathway pseudopilin PulG
MKQSGFTFMEVCITISLLSFLIFLTLPPLVTSLQRQQSQLFISQLASDLYYTGNLARTGQTIFYLEILPLQKQYIIYSPFGSLRKKRTIPSGLKVNSNFLRNRISYNAIGQISQGGTITIIDQAGRTCRIITQLSSGRFRISYE